MEEEKKPLSLEDPVPFTYPEGLQQVAEMLTFLPEPMRIPLLLGTINYACVSGLV